MKPTATLSCLTAPQRATIFDAVERLRRVILACIAVANAARRTHVTIRAGRLQAGQPCSGTSHAMKTSATNPYCEVLGITVPSLPAVKDHREANTYGLMIVALLERGGPMTLPEVAERFARAGVAPKDDALRSLTRCRPARPPLYRDGDRYVLDPHDDELHLWAFRLGLRPPRVSATPPPPKAAAPLPGADVPLTTAELDEAWREASLSSWSSQRVALCVLDAHREAMTPAQVVAFASARTQWHPLRETDRRWGQPSPIRVLQDGRWALEPGHPWLPSARKAVRDRLGLVRKWAGMRPDLATIHANRRAAEERREKHGAELARLRRVVVHAFPPAAPQVVVLVDVARRALGTYSAADLPRVRERLDGYDVIAAIEVRPLLRALGYEPGPRRLAELGPPQKTIALNRRGRVLRITTAMLLWGSCGIGRHFGDEKRLHRYLKAGQTTRLRRRLEADAKALLALYQYGRLQGAVRLRWGLLHAMIQAPWVHPDETRLYGLKARAHELGVALEVVAGSAPGWKAPWARARRCRVVSGRNRWDLQLVDDSGAVVHDRDIQLARLVERVH